jgi:hypothetical protein
MSNEINFSYVSGSKLYAIIKSAIGQYYNATSVLFEVFNINNWSSYNILLSEIAPTSGQFQASFPIVSPGVYTIEVYNQSGASSVPQDVPPVGIGAMQWSGVDEIPLALLARTPAIFGNVISPPSPSMTNFNINLMQPLAASTVPQSFSNLILTCMPGGANGPPTWAEIMSCTIVSQQEISIALRTPLPVLPVVNDPMAISG